MTTTTPTFCEMVRGLEDEWRARGCVILPGWDRPVGAGTLAPHTAMRLVGDDPWRAAYTQACRRPADVLDATHTQRHHQFQVILKPAPDDPLDLIREVLNPDMATLKSDTWEHPALGASGVGWEASVNGIEVAQITIFNRIGRQICEPALEIAYGLERCAMVQQGVGTIPEIRWDDNHLYGDVHPSDYDVSGDAYNRTCSQIRNLNQELQNRLSKYQNARGLAFYENILEVSHLINLLDARGALAPEAKTSNMRRACDLMEKFVTGDFGEIPAQPFYQIYHPALGLTHKREGRVAELAQRWGDDTADNLERLVALWGVGERAESGNDPYRLEESARALGHLRVKELAQALEVAATIIGRGAEKFTRAGLDELTAFIVDACADAKFKKTTGKAVTT